MTASSLAPRRRNVLPGLLLVLTVFGPISMDVYLPALPHLTDALGATTSVAQLTVTACLIGLAAGQLIAGPMSDQFGRRRVVIVGTVSFVVTSLLCAASPTVEVLIAVRLLQGLAGGAGIVIAQAAGRDVFGGPELIRFYGRLTVTGAIAAILGPMVGGFLTSITDWRGVFVVLSIVGAVILTATLFVFDETLPADQRVRGGFTQTRHDVRVLLSDRRFFGVLLSQGFVWAAVFAYLAGATFVLQDIYGLSPQWYAAAFGLNSAGFALFGWLGSRSAERWSINGTLTRGITAAAIGASGLLAAGITHLPLWEVIASLFTLASGVAASTPPATTIAMADYPHIAGTASSLLGTVRFGFGAVAAPLVGIAGSTSILPLGIVTLTSIALGAAAHQRTNHRATVDTSTSSRHDHSSIGSTRQ